jgi:hypothetical protein
VVRGMVGREMHRGNRFGWPYWVWTFAGAVVGVALGLLFGQLSVNRGGEVKVFLVLLWVTSFAASLNFVTARVRRWRSAQHNASP